MSLNITPINATGSGAPSGPAGGALTGTYPNPTLAGVATGQVLYGTGAGVAGSEAGLAWTTATKELAILGNSPIALRTSTTAGFQGINIRNAANTLAASVNFSDSTASFLPNSFFIGSRILTNPTIFIQGDVEAFRVAPTTRNLLINTTADDGTNRLQVAVPDSTGISVTSVGTIVDSRTPGGGGAYVQRNASGTGFFWRNVGTDMMSLNGLGTLELRNQTPTTGSTSLIVRAGAGQGSNNLTTWQNSAGSSLAAIASNGAAYFQQYYDAAGTNFNLNATALDVRSAYLLRFSSTTAESGPKDTGLARNAAGVLEINSGTAGTFRDLALRGIRPVGVTVANLPAAAGNTGMLCTVTDANANTIGTTVVGGGALTVLVWSNGTNWRIYAN